jgi:cell division protein ZapB
MQGFSNYSGAMDADLKTLEVKVSQLLGLCQRMRTENFELRQALAQAQDESRQLKENMALASERLEALIDGLPEGMA